MIIGITGWVKEKIDKKDEKNDVWRMWIKAGRNIGGGVRMGLMITRWKRIFWCGVVGIGFGMGMGGGVYGVDWPEFRGPGGDGEHELGDEYPVEWGREKDIEWRVEVPGSGWSSPSLSGGRVVVTSAIADGDGYRLVGMAYQESSGELLWQRGIFDQDAEGSRIHRKNSHASPTPLILDGERVVVHFGHSGTACLSMEDGSILWKTSELSYASVHGNGGSPVYVDGRLIFSCDGAADPFVVGLDAETGAVVWKTPRTVTASKTFSFCTGLVTEIGGRRQVVLPGSNMVAGYDPLSGEEIWKVRYDGYSVVPRPIHEGGLIFLSTGYDRPSLLAINPEGTGDLGEGAIVWKSSRSIAKTPSFLVKDGLLYNLSDNGVLSCMEAGSGALIYDERLGGEYSSSPLLVNGRIYCTSEAGVTTVVLPGRVFMKTAENDLAERTLASIAVGNNGRLLYRSEKHLYSLRKE